MKLNIHVSPDPYFSIDQTDKFIPGSLIRTFNINNHYLILARKIVDFKPEIRLLLLPSLEIFKLSYFHHSIRFSIIIPGDKLVMSLSVEG